MKRFLALMLASVMCMSLLAGCRRNDRHNEQEESTPPVVEDMTPEQNAPENSSPQNDSSTENAEPNSMDDASANLKADSTLEDIVMRLGEELGIAMPSRLDEEKLKDVFGIQPEWLEEYYGEYSAANTSADHLIAFKVKEGHMADVKSALEKRREAIINGFEQSLLEELDKARNATIVEKDPYLFFVIAGDVNTELDKEVNRAKEIIDSYFE